MDFRNLSTSRESSSRITIDPDHPSNEVFKHLIQNSREDSCGKKIVRKRGPKRKKKYVGVFYIKGSRKWSARIDVRGKQKYLGLHEKPEIAARVYDTWARRFHGECATLNFP